VSLYDSVRDLPLQVDGYSLEGLQLQARPEFLRKTTIVHLHGAGDEGIGEDVTYDAAAHDRQQERGPTLPLVGEWTIDSFSRHLAAQPLFDPLPERLVYLDYRRWAFECAALDLALRQAGTSLGEAVGREPRDITFVVSMALGEPPDTGRFHAWLSLYPNLRFKLDANSQWTDELVSGLVATGAVNSIDFKGYYQGTTVDTPPDAALYRRVAEGLPEAWLEDPALTDETTPVLEPHRDRITWDAPIHSVQDIEGLLWPPRTVNVKPSRFGSIERLFAAYDYCEARGIGAYGGGQWELGPGRGHIQLLASLFHPETPNDVAPREFNLDPQPGLPESPLEIRPRKTGFLAL
jgi:L-alanine-DL-glutamate epimerase-like enolase superfamily enzyme